MERLHRKRYYNILILVPTRYMHHPHSHLLSLQYNQLVSHQDNLLYSLLSSLQPIQLVSHQHNRQDSHLGSHLHNPPLNLF